MVKKTLYFGNPAYISLRMQQLVITIPQSKYDLPLDKKVERTIPIEDIGVIILDDRQITITQGALEVLLANNCAIITCDSKRMPVGLMLPLTGNTIQTERFKSQINSSLPLKKQLWQQTVEAKIRNQASLLKSVTGIEHSNMLKWASCVKSGDSDNMEARAAVYYWKTVFPRNPMFVRDYEEDGSNSLLNYGYAILRAIVARGLVAGGLIPTLGIHHHNRYNAYCLADDIMEPYRPYVDKVVVDILDEDPDALLNQRTKVKLLGLPTLEVLINEKRSPLMNAVSQTVISLVKCFKGESRRLIYPEM